MTPDEYKLLEETYHQHERDAILTRIAFLRNQLGEDINCFQFHLALKRDYPYAKAWYLDGDHILTEINGDLYDKSGMRACPFNDELQFKRAFGWDA